MISTKLTRFIKVINILLFVFLTIFSILGFIYIQNSLSFFIIPLIFFAYMVLRIIPQKTIYYNSKEIFYYKNNKLEKVDFLEIENIERVSYFGLTYEIKTKQKRKLFDQLVFTPSLKELFRSFIFSKPNTITELERLINEKKGSCQHHLLFK